MIKRDNRKITYTNVHLGRFTVIKYQHLKKLLINNNSVTIHVKKLRILATELHKTKENLADPIKHEVFEIRNIQNYPRSQTDFQLGSVKTVNSGLRTLRYLGPKI